MHNNLKMMVSAVLEAHPDVLAIALRQRAKFEGWLKLELAAAVEKNGYSAVELETPLPTNRGERADLLRVVECSVNERSAFVEPGPPG